MKEVSVQDKEPGALDTCQSLQSCMTLDQSLSFPKCQFSICKNWCVTTCLPRLSAFNRRAFLELYNWALSRDQSLVRPSVRPPQWLCCGPRLSLHQAITIALTATPHAWARGGCRFPPSALWPLSHRADPSLMVCLLFFSTQLSPLSTVTLQPCAGGSCAGSQERAGDSD